jgi:hypothetical protein
MVLVRVWMSGSMSVNGILVVIDCGFGEFEPKFGTGLGEALAEAPSASKQVNSDEWRLNIHVRGLKASIGNKLRPVSLCVRVTCGQ